WPTVKKELLAQLEEQLQDPFSNAVIALERQTKPWPKDNVRYVPTLQEQIDRLKKVELKDVEAVYRQLWGANQVASAVVGDFDEVATRGALEQGLAAWNAVAPWKRIDEPYRPTAPGFADLVTPDKANAVVGVAQSLEIRDDDPDFPSLQMVSYMLGAST